LNLSHIISDASIVGCAINIVALAAFFRHQALRRQFSAMMVYLAFKAAADITLLSLMRVHLFSPSTMYDAYFGVYWLSFLVGRVTLYFAMRQIFDHVMAPLPGLQKVGRILFRWVAVTSTIIVIATALHPYGLSLRAIPLALIELMRCTSILELCMLAFLALSVDKLGLSYRSHVFGIGLGLGMLATTDFVMSALAHFGTTMVSTISLFGELGALCAFMLWTGYFLVREPARKTLMMPATSQLLRWNEIAMAIGHTSGQMVMTPAPKPFFLDEVEKTVDRVLSRNSVDLH
jgi:hypothetical protein